MNIVNDILVNTLFTDTDFVQTLEMNSVVPKYVENQEKGNPSVCKNCAEAPLKDLHIYGRSEQMTTTGAQLLDLHDLIGKTETKNGATYKINEDQSITVSGTPTEYTSFYLKAMSLKAGSYYFLRNSDDKVFVQLISAKADMNNGFTLDEDADGIGVYVVFNVASNNTQSFNSTFTPMLNTGSTALPWEPYTGGKPSPSPDYPQEIVNAGKDGNLNVMVRGKNLLELTDTKVQNNNLKFEINKGSITFSGTADGASFIHKIKDFVVPRDGIYTISTNSDDSINESPRILISVNGAALENAFAGVTKELSTGSVISLYIRVSVAGSYNGRMIKPMIEKNSEGTVYEPYHEPQSMPVTTPNGLPGIPVSSGGNYTDENGQQWICDEVDLGRGVYVQRVYSVIVDGVNVAFSQGGLYCNINLRKMPSAKPANTLSQSVVAKSTFTSEPWNFNQEYGFLYLAKENYAEILNESCKKHPGEVIYALATPIETPLTTAEIAAYKSLRTYRGTTIVEAEDKAGIFVKYNMPMPKLSKNGALRRWFKRHPII